jgi:hypothetical protein
MRFIASGHLVFGIVLMRSTVVVDSEVVLVVGVVAAVVEAALVVAALVVAALVEDT